MIKDLHSSKAEANIDPPQNTVNAFKKTDFGFQTYQQEDKLSEGVGVHSPMGYGELIRTNSNFRFLWFGQIITLLGNWFNLIASAALIAMLTGSGFAVGGLFVVRMLAPFLVSPVSGVLADRYNRRRILIIGDIVQGITVFGFMFVREPGDIWLLYTLSAIQMAISSVFFTSRRAMLPDVVPRRALGVANALGSATWSTMLGIGAAAGGLVSGTWGIYPAFLIDGLTFFVSALLISRVALHSEPDKTSKDKSIIAGLREYLDGFKFLRNNPDILVIALHKAAISLFLRGAFEVVQVRIAEDIFTIGVAGGLTLGLMYAISGVGNGTGPLIARVLTKDNLRLLRLTIIFGYATGALGLFIISTLNNFTEVLVGVLINGFGTGIVWVFSTQLLLFLVPSHIRGRVFSVEMALFALTGAIAAIAGGSVLDFTWSLTAIIQWMAGLALLPAILWSIWHLRGNFVARTAEEI